MTVAVFASGVLLLLLGHKNRLLLEVHKVAFIVWGVTFAVHFLAHAQRVLRSLRVDWGAPRRAAVPGAGVRGLLVAAAVGGGAALALALLSTIEGWRA